ncbi:Lymphoid enhancer-binding factor 1 [Nibea albiflora]|uniref:Lymphoid enhancer-binding factor 1 n=1 Tax=Nibea albiflora TaxID=240163 RepID=A0ACB7F2V9_NIBAL|nr:Lymphoid enhancer-binding factor 1 [Nibea albiflora]
MNAKEMGGGVDELWERLKGRMEEGKEKSCNGGGRTEETKERHQSQDLPGYYSLPPGGVSQITPPMGWQSQPVYPALSPCGFRQPYSSNLSSASSYSRFPHSLMLSPSGMHPTGIPHPAIVPPTGKQDHEQYDRSMYVKPQEVKREKEPKKPVIKKPLNAFMLYMKEMRAKVIAECTLKESAAINQILGRRGKKKRRKREKLQDSNTDPGSPKKCRARFGLNQQTDWCGPCRWEKEVHSLPSRRRLSQPNFFRYKCYRLSPLPIPRPPPSVPAPAPPPFPRLLPATAHLPVDTPPPVPATTHALAHTLTPAAVCGQAQRPPSARDQTHPPHTPGTVRQADTQLDDGAVGRQGRRTFSQSANRDSVIAPVHSHPQTPRSPQLPPEA